MIEINGNLEDEKKFDTFYQVLNKVIYIFVDCFGKEVMSKYDLFIDNATKNSGYTPITTVLLKKDITIKLGIKKFSHEDVIAYQFAHELCHFVFYSLMGLDKEHADSIEENICSAMSLIIINMLYPDKLKIWLSHVNHLKNKNYNKGGIIAEKCQFNINLLKEEIIKLANDRI